MPGGDRVPGMDAERLRAAGDRELADRLLGDREVKEAIKRIERQAGEAGARRHLLGSAIRLTPEMAPDVHAILEACRASLGLESPVETFVYPEASFNAAAVRPENGQLMIILSSGLLEAFDPGELRFVAGHEFGHHLFEHHRIPVPLLADEAARLGQGLVLRIFAWQRYAEISADRAGVFCAGGIDAAAAALFKLASGLRGGRVQVRIDQFLAQAGDLRDEAERHGGNSEGPRTDWFSTHPFSPLRLQAAERFARSELMAPGGMPVDELEAGVEDLMAVMRPSYLKERSGVAEAMRRLLFAGGIAVAAASGKIAETELKELERLLGPGSVPPELKPDVILRDLPSRIEAVNAGVPPLRRAQVIRDLCLIARADGRVDRAELKVIRDLASAIEVDPSVVDCALASRRGMH